MREWATMVVLAFSVWLVMSQSDAIPTQSDAIPTQSLRCHNAPTPRAWTKTDAEAALLYAQASLDAARTYSGSPQHKAAFALESIAASLLVERCWR